MVPVGLRAVDHSASQPTKGSMAHSLISEIFREVSWFVQPRPLSPDATAEQEQGRDTTDDQSVSRRLGNGVHHPEVADNALGLSSCS